jgi:hypothetical protein
MKSEKGKSVFEDNVDDILAKKIIDHSHDSAGEHREKAAAPDAAGKTGPYIKTTFTYRTPEEKRRAKTAGYGLASLVFLALLGVVAFLWSGSRKD